MLKLQDSLRVQTSYWWDSRIVSEQTYWTYRSSSADTALISRVSENNTSDGEELQHAIIEFRRLVNQKKRGFDRLIQASDHDNSSKNYIRARLEVQKEDPGCIHTIKEILQKHGLAVPLFMGDWLVTRDGKAQAEACGTRRFADIQTYLTPWYHKNWLITDEKHPYRRNGTGWKFVHLSNWCGSGDIMLENQSNTDLPFWKGKWTTTDYWSEVGLCDKIYFSLSALFRRCLKPWHNQEHILEFCDFLTTCINKDIQVHRRDTPDDPHYLEIDINYLQEYLLENASWYEKRIKDNTYQSDDEFPDGKETVRLSKNAVDLVKSFIRNPREELDKYFVSEFQNGTIDGIAPFLFHNIFVWKFEEFDNIFSGNEPCFHMITSVRWSSHIDNIAYKNLLRNSCKKLKSGGIIIDDGIRRSYTRECRWKEMVELSEELGEDYKFHFIKSSTWEILSVFIQRIATTPKWEKVFLTPYEIKEGITWKDGGIAIPINTYGKDDLSEKTYLVQAEVRWAIMAGLLWWHDREESDWDSLLKLGPVQDAIDSTESAFRKITDHVVIQWSSRQSIKEYIVSISAQVFEKLWNHIIKTNSSADIISSLQKLSNKPKKWRKPAYQE